MGMSTHIQGIVPPDDKWKKMKEAYDACNKAGIDIPEEIEAFFNYEIPDDKGVIIEVENHEAVQKCSPHEMAEGYEVEIAKLPKNVKFIRFYNSY